jgi:hypothetical protein
MIQTLSQMHLLIAALLMAGSGLLSAGLAVSMYFLYERLEKMFARRKAAAKQLGGDSSEKPNAAQI